jgi:hypothetical protein
MIKYLCICIVLTISVTHCQEVDEAAQMMKDMNQIINAIIATDLEDDMDMVDDSQVQINISLDGFQTTETIETIITDDDMPLTTVIVTRRNLKSGGARVNPFQIFEGISAIIQILIICSNQC